MIIVSLLYVSRAPFGCIKDGSLLVSDVSDNIGPLRASENGGVVVMGQGDESPGTAHSAET